MAMSARQLMPWALLAASVGAGVYVSWQLNAGRQAEAALRHATEQDNLRLKGLVVGRDQTIAQLQDGAAELARRVPELQQALAAALKAAPGATPAAVIEASTGQLPIVAPPALPPPALPPLAPAPAECKLWGSDKLELKLAAVALDTTASNWVLAGGLRAERASDGALVASGPFKADLTEVEVKRPTFDLARWGAGPAVFAGPGGLTYGVAAGAPPLRLFNHELQLIGAAAVGQHGLQGGAFVLIR